MTNRGTRVTVRLGGEAGQGIVHGGILLAEAALIDGFQVAQSARYGAAVRGGEAIAAVILDREPIDFPYVETANYFVALSQAAYVGYINLTDKKGTVFYDPFFVKIPEKIEQEHISIHGTQSALEGLSSSVLANMVVLGGVLEHTQIVSFSSMEQAVQKYGTATVQRDNLRALALGSELARQGVV